MSNYILSQASTPTFVVRLKPYDIIYIEVLSLLVVLFYDPANGILSQSRSRRLTYVPRLVTVPCSWPDHVVDCLPSAW